MNIIASIAVTAILCVGSFFLGGYHKAKELEAIRTAIHQETKRALDDVKLEVARVEKEYNGKIDLIQKQWDSEIAPLLEKAKSKCKAGSSSVSCREANNAVLETIFGLKEAVN